MKWLFVHFVFSFLLFSDWFHHESLFIKRFYKTQRSSVLSKMKPPLANKKHQSFIRALSTGYKRSFKRYPEYDALKNANMLHLLTPSGLHLSALTLPIYFIFKSSRIRIFILGLLILGLFSLPGLEAAKRVMGLKLLLNCYHSIRTVFILVFALAFLIKPGLSFLLSYFFIGVIILNPYRTAIKSLVLLSLAQILITQFFEQPYYPLSLLINPLGSLFISFGFPVIIITSRFPSLYSITSFHLVETFWNLTNLVYKVSPLFPNDVATIICGLILLSSKKWRYKLLSLSIIFYRPLSVI